ncbi:MAG: DUF4258 domain-containing protein [Acidobacteria bacterium]|nr:DUF4258 domain-containing protein [Acidobacteriota bacterium]
MSHSGDGSQLLEMIRGQAARKELRLTAHAQAEMVEEEIALDEILQTLNSGRVLESYPEHRRGASCLIGGYTAAGRPLHVVCTTARPVLIIITVYEPKPPKWPTPEERGLRL